MITAIVVSNSDTAGAEMTYATPELAHHYLGAAVTGTNSVAGSSLNTVVADAGFDVGWDWDLLAALGATDPLDRSENLRALARTALQNTQRPQNVDAWADALAQRLAKITD